MRTVFVFVFESHVGVGEAGPVVVQSGGTSQLLLMRQRNPQPLKLNVSNVRIPSFPRGSLVTSVLREIANAFELDSRIADAGDERVDQDAAALLQLAAANHVLQFDGSR